MGGEGGIGVEGGMGVGSIGGHAGSGGSAQPSLLCGVGEAVGNDNVMIIMLF